MDCPKCGSENSPHARFCQRCGFDIKSAPVEKPAQPIIASSPSDEAQSAPVQSASNPTVNPANPAQREEIVIPLPSTTPATPQQPTLAGVPVQPTSMGTQANPFVVTIVPGVSYAGFWLRVAAALIDWMILFATSFIIFLPIGIVIGVMGAVSQLPQNSIDVITGLLSLVGNVFAIIASWLYYAGLESSSRQATVGKMAVGIKVVGLDGKRISFARATGRYFAKLIPDFDIVTIWFTEKKQAIHDMIAGTLVVKK